MAREEGGRKADGSRRDQTDLCGLFQCLRLYLQVVFLAAAPACDQLPRHRPRGPRPRCRGWYGSLAAIVSTPLPSGRHRPVWRYAQESLEESAEIWPDYG